MLSKILILGLFVLICVQAAPSNKVVGGHDAKKGEFPHQISLRYGYWWWKSHVCGGTILTPTWVLTAAHCITDITHVPFGGYYVVAGINSLSEGGQLIAEKRNIVHPGYKGRTNGSDLALVELKYPLIFDKYVQAAILPSPGEYPKEEKGVLSGWGSTSSTTTPSFPDMLQTVDVTLMSYSECKTALELWTGTSNPLEPTNICSGPTFGGISACSGDSGGPLVTRADEGKYKLIGVVSWGYSPCGTRGIPSVYVRVSAYIDWIMEYIK